MKRRLLFVIFIIAGLVGAKALLAKEPETDLTQKAKQFKCADTVLGELLIKLKANKGEPTKILKLRNNRLEIATYGMSGDRVIALNNVEFQELQNKFSNKNYSLTNVTPIQSVFKDGANNGKLPQGATGLREENAPIIKINFEKSRRSKNEKTFTQQNKELNRDFKENKKYSAQSLVKINAYKRELNTLMADLVKLYDGDIELIEPSCKNVRETTAYVPSPPNPNDETYVQGDNWGLKNWGVWGTVNIDINYADAWRMMWQVWRQIPSSRRVMSIVGAGVDDRDIVGQNPDLVNVFDGSYVASGLGSGEYYTFLGSEHELHVTGIALAGNNNITGTIGFTTGKAFLSVCNDGTPVINTNFIEAIDQAANASDIVNISYTYSGDDPAIFQVLNGLQARGVIAVFGAANDGLDLDNVPPGEDRGYPCRLGLSNTLCAAGIDSNGVRATFGGGGSSNYGLTRVHTVAPAADIMTTVSGAGGVYTFVSGTSYAGPFISAMMAAVKAFRPSRTVEQIRDLIIDPANIRTSFPQPLSPTGGLIAASGSIPDFQLVLDAAARMVPCGDMNSSGGIDVSDALILARSVVGLIPGRDSIADDYSGDGAVDVRDALRLAQKAAGLPVSEACPGSVVN